MDEKYYERMYKANIKLVDENTTLKNDIDILEKRIKKATEYMANYILTEDKNEDVKIKFMVAMNIMNGEDYEQDNS